jgi:hypothetical protein
VNYSAVRGITESVTNGRQVVAAPHGRAETLRNLLRNPVAKNGKLVIELMVGSDNFFAHVRGRVVSA